MKECSNQSRCSKLSTMSAERTCPRCQSLDRQVKCGRTRRGSRRYLCRLCERLYTPAPLPLGYPEGTRREAVRLYLEGTKLRRIGRTLRVSPQSAANRVNAYRAGPPAAPPAPGETGAPEVDELFTSVGSKNAGLPRDFG